MNSTSRSKDTRLSLHSPWPLLPMQESLERLQPKRAHCENSRAQEKHRSATWRVQMLEEWVRVETIVAIAQLDPEPVSERQCGGEDKGGQDGYCPRRGEEEEVQSQYDRGQGMEGHVGENIQRDRPVGEDEAGVDLFRKIKARISRASMLIWGDWTRTVRRPQYIIEMRTSIGALVMARKFFARKRPLDRVMSERRPMANVMVASDRPMMVRYCSYIVFASSRNWGKFYMQGCRH